MTPREPESATFLNGLNHFCLRVIRAAVISEDGDARRIKVASHAIVVDVLQSSPRRSTCHLRSTTSSTCTLNIGAHQGYVLAPPALLPLHQPSDPSAEGFLEDAIISLISEGDELVYRHRWNTLVSW